MLDSNDSHCCATTCNNCSKCSAETYVLEATSCNEKCTSQEVADLSPDNSCKVSVAKSESNRLSKLSLDLSKGKVGCPCQNSSGKCADHLVCLATAAGLESKTGERGSLKSTRVESHKLPTTCKSTECGTAKIAKLVKKTADCREFATPDTPENATKGYFASSNCVLMSY